MIEVTDLGCGIPAGLSGKGFRSFFFHQKRRYGNGAGRLQKNCRIASGQIGLPAQSTPSGHHPCPGFHPDPIRQEKDRLLLPLNFLKAKDQVHETNRRYEIIGYYYSY